MRIHDTTLITIAGGGGEHCYCSCGGPSLCCVSTSTPLRLPPTSSHPCHRHLCRPHRETKDPRTDACLLVSIPILSDAEWNSVSMPADTRGRPAFARTHHPRVFIRPRSMNSKSNWIDRIETFLRLLVPSKRNEKFEGIDLIGRRR